MSLPSHMADDGEMDRGPEYCLDAGSSGNVARFINHSCQPNLFVQCVLSSHHDAKLARVLLFASENIPPLKVSSPLKDRRCAISVHSFILLISFCSHEKNDFLFCASTCFLL